MKLKRILTILICLLLTVSLTAGCGKQSGDNQPSDGSSATDGEASAAESIDVSKAYSALDPETVVMKVNGDEITWKDYFYLLNYYIKYVEGYTGGVDSLNTEIREGYTYLDFVKDGALDWLKYSRAVEAGAREMNVELDAEKKATLENNWKASIEEYGSEEALLEELEKDYCTKDLYMYLVKTTLLSDACFESLYGENGSKLTEQELKDHFENDGYMMAKHILLMTASRDANGNMVALSDEEIAEKRALAEEILEKLDSYTGDDFEAYFDELAAQYSEDTGLAAYPDGYLFQSNDMVSEFENGYRALKVGEYSRIVESDYGYHIIYSIPINYDVVPMAYKSYASSGNYTLRYLAASEMFTSVTNGWMEDVSVEYTDAYNNIDLAKLFK